MTRELPDSAHAAWWLTAWLRGHVPPDSALEALLDEDAAHHVTGLPDHGEPVTLAIAVGALRSLGAESAGLALPVEGDPVGLGGPRDFNEAALAAGEAVVVVGAGVGMVPHRAGRGVVWQCLPAERRPLVDVGEGDRQLRSGLLEAADQLAALDVARWAPEVADELIDLRSAHAPAAPSGTPRQCVDLAGRSLRALTVCDLALRDDGGALTAYDARRRRDALQPLARAGRRGLVAACSPEAWPPG